jgi:hypothetical protein
VQIAPTTIDCLSEGSDILAGATGLEPAASCVTGRRSKRIRLTAEYSELCRFMR